MPAKLVYTVHICIELKKKDGTVYGRKFPKIGAVVQFDAGGLGGNFDLRPWNNWDGRFLLFPPDNKTPGAGEVPVVPEEDIESAPY
jgi:hypothetical protein